MDTQKINAIFECFRQANPHPRTELNYHTPFELLIAVILSAQATDITVNRATEKLFQTANTPEAILLLEEEELKHYIHHIGLYNTKAKHIIATCRILTERYDGSVPHDRKALESLPGVGRKTTNVILNTAFREPVIAVDTHIFRVANRTRLAPGKTPRQVEDRLMEVISDEFKYDAHHWLVLHGRYVCVARKPKCGQCLIEKWCEYPDKNLELQRAEEQAASS